MDYGKNVPAGESEYALAQLVLQERRRGILRLIARQRLATPTNAASDIGMRSRQAQYHFSLLLKAGLIQPLPKPRFSKDESRGRLRPYMLTVRGREVVSSFGLV